MRHQCWCLMVLLLFVVSGCTGGLRTEYVEGIVTLDGVPLEKAFITFMPSGEGETRIAAGDTDANGKYVLTTAEGGKPGRGAVQGEYKVTISKRKPVDEPTAAEPQQARSGPPSAQEMASGEAARRSAGLPPPYAYITPRQYNDPDASGFTATVVRGKNRFDFDMVSDGQ